MDCIVLLSRGNGTVSNLIGAQVYMGSSITLQLTMGIETSGAGTALILYRKPNGVTGTFAATVVAAGIGTIQKIMSTTDLDLEGVWKFNAKWVDAASAEFIGETVPLLVIKPGECP